MDVWKEEIKSLLAIKMQKALVNRRLAEVIANEKTSSSSFFINFCPFLKLFCCLFPCGWPMMLTVYIKEVSGPCSQRDGRGLLE
jgi:hypothetical protein